MRSLSTKILSLFVVFLVQYNALSTKINSKNGKKLLPVMSKKLELFPKKPVIVGYTDSISEHSVAKCFPPLKKALNEGVNVMIWTFINMGGPFINNKPSFETKIQVKCLRKVREYAEKKNLATKHFVSFGGWNAKHPSTDFTPEKWWNAFQKWNSKFEFDGIDWDIEGNSDIENLDNNFNRPLLDLMGKMSVFAKKSGMFVSIAPPESYLDYTTTKFDFSLENNYTEWPSFFYHGHNTYAYLIAKYGNYIDLVMPQLYETKSHISYQVNKKHVRPAKYLEKLIKAMTSGWIVDFTMSSDPEVQALGRQKIVIKSSKLVLGFATGWANNKGGTLFIDMPEVGVAYQSLLQQNIKPKGFMYWSIKEDGRPYMKVRKHIAQGLNKFLHVRS